MPLNRFTNRSNLEVTCLQAKSGLLLCQTSPTGRPWPLLIDPVASADQLRLSYSISCHLLNYKFPLYWIKKKKLNKRREREATSNFLSSKRPEKEVSLAAQLNVCASLISSSQFRGGQLLGPRTSSHDSSSCESHCVWIVLDESLIERAELDERGRLARSVQEEKFENSSTTESQSMNSRVWFA